MNQEIDNFFFFKNTFSLSCTEYLCFPLTSPGYIGEMESYQIKEMTFTNGALGSTYEFRAPQRYGVLETPSPKYLRLQYVYGPLKVFL